MNRMAIVGSLWGDEGKGKVVNYFSDKYEWLVRFSGGSNAGHTIYYNEKKYVNHLLPCIKPDNDSKSFLGAGMVIDLEQLVSELEDYEKEFKGYASRVYIDPEAFLVLPWHKEEDGFLEDMRREPIGTTKRGIGPAYTDKSSREGIKLYHLFDKETLKERLLDNYHLKKNKYKEKFSLSADEMLYYLLNLKDKLLNLKVNFTSAIDMVSIFRNTSVLFEGAQGVLLDLDFGTYPFVTSGSCMAHGVSSVGFSTFELDNVMAVLKAYTTRVGAGPFPTEEEGELAEKIRQKGNEFGATTGRPRRVGWMDLPALRYAKIRSGYTDFVMTKADVLNGFEKIKVCTAYKCGDEIIEVPSTSFDFFRAEPIYEELPGWEDTHSINFLKYITYIEEKIGIPIDYISYGPKTYEMESKSDMIMNLK